MTEKLEQPHITKIEQRRMTFEQTSEFARLSIEQERAERREKTARLRALRVARQKDC